MLLRDALGETLRDARTRQSRTLRDVSEAANVSLGYLSEVERGRKEASSELLASICDALEIELSDVLDTASSALRDRAAVAVPRLPVAGGHALGGGRRLVTGNSTKPAAASVRPDANRRTRPGAIRIVVPYPGPATAAVN